MQCFLFHLMPYASLDLDYDKEYKASWVVYPNSISTQGRTLSL